MFVANLFQKFWRSRSKVNAIKMDRPCAYIKDFRYKNVSIVEL